MCSRYLLGALGVAGILLGTGSVCAADPQTIQTAIQRGRDFLIATQQKQQPYTGGSHGSGSAALVGLALLENGSQAKHPLIQQIAQVIRERAISETRTYYLALDLLFLDRLGEPGDTVLLQELGFRLLMGQNAQGGWSYQCLGGVSPAEQQTLRKLVPNVSKLQTAPKPPRKPSPAPFNREEPPARSTTPLNHEDEPVASAQPLNRADAPASPSKSLPFPGVRGNARLSAMMQQRLVALRRQHGEQQVGDDNSNTQFGLLGLWVARRYAVPVDEALTRLDQRFRASQDRVTGGWGYLYGQDRRATPAMTCAGLLGLAVSQSRASELRSYAKNHPSQDLTKLLARFPEVQADKDPVLEAGLKCLGKFLQDDRDQQDLYFLWSLERVAVAFDLSTIGQIDWYDWGTDRLLASQKADGSWSGGFHAGNSKEVASAFALLFLARANLTSDMTQVLQGKVADPGRRMLRGGLGQPTKPAPPRTTKQVKSAPPMPPVPPVPMLPSEGSIPRPRSQAARNTNDPKMRAWRADVNRLRDQFLAAQGAAQQAQLRQLRDQKGSVHTAALAEAIEHLIGPSRDAARTALAQRLTRMTARTLRRQLQDSHQEIRRAAALACAIKRDRGHIPDLLGTLNDADDPVVQAARVALKQLTEQDFGPAPGASPREQTQAVAAWRRWWDQQR